MSKIPVLTWIFCEYRKKNQKKNISLPTDDPPLFWKCNWKQNIFLFGLSALCRPEIAPEKGKNKMTKQGWAHSECLEQNDVALEQISPGK